MGDEARIQHCEQQAGAPVKVDTPHTPTLLQLLLGFGLPVFPWRRRRHRTKSSQRATSENQKRVESEKKSSVRARERSLHSRAERLKQNRTRHRHALLAENIEDARGVVVHFAVFTPAYEHALALGPR